MGYIKQFENFNGRTVVPFIRWGAASGYGYNSPAYKGITTKTVVQGSLDNYIRQYAVDIKAYGKPVFLQPICGEFNGSWWYNCSPGANSTLTAQDFVGAWRRVVDIFRQQGVANVAWVWTPNTFPPPPAKWSADSNLDPYYPGDDYVDWAGADHYNYDKRFGGPAASMDTVYNFAVTHGKPFLLV